ncbi:MAG: sigma-70 family RNA polymerase sigma factor [Bacteroidota bacterium]
MDTKRHAQHLWQRYLADGDSVVFRDLYDLTYDHLFRYGHRINRDAPAVRDALQEVYLAIWQRRDRVPPVRDPWVFLLVSLRNRIIDEARRKRIIAVEHSPTASPEEALLAVETEAMRNHWLGQQLDKLPERQREALHLRYHLELDYSEVADVLGVSQQVAYNYVNRGVKALKKGVDTRPEWFF